MLLNPRAAAEQLAISTVTLRKWAEQGKIKCVLLKSGHRRYYQEEIDNVLKTQTSFTGEELKNENPTELGDERELILYARVSSKKQEPDLQNQIQYLQTTYPNGRVIKDIASGINFKRKGLRTLLELIFNGKVKTVVVANKDRLSRFGYELFEWMFIRFGTTIHVLSGTKKVEPDLELATDLLSIITVFSSRYYGRRKYTRKAPENIPQSTTESAI